MPICSEAARVDAIDQPRHVAPMTRTTLDLTGLKCPLPALKTRKALKPLQVGDQLEVHCTDPLSVIDIPNLIRETGDKVEITERNDTRIVFLIEKANGLIESVNGAPQS
jgi:tRNA 2-thiouridine synthesizing protein A